MDLRILDGLRGLAAFYVVVHHAFAFLWRGASATDTPLALLIQNTFSFGHQAVLLFFMISGFCIHYGQARSGVQRINTVAFAVRRARRLYPPLLLALIITAVLDHVGMHIRPDYYGQPSGLHDTITVGSSYTLETIIGNLLFQARLWVPELGSNAPWWSLAIEFWFYMLYPVMLMAFRRFGPARATLAITVVSATCSCLLYSLPRWPLGVLSYWALWVVGALIAEDYVRGGCPTLVRRIGPLTPIALLGLGVLSFVLVHQRKIPDLWWGGVMAVGLAYVLLAPETRSARFVQRVSIACRPLGQISYSLYLVHYPLLALIAATWLTMRGALPSGVELVAFGVVGALGFGWLARHAVERHCVAGRASPVPRVARSTARVSLGRERVRARAAPISVTSLAEAGRVLACGRGPGRQHGPASDRLSRHPAGSAPAAGLVAAP